jgi:serine protease Do
MALAVPIDVVMSIAADLKKSGKVERGWLGVSVAEKDGKVEIATIDSKSPAELAKLKEGDLILKIDGKDITSGPSLSSEIRSRKPGQDITARIERDGKPLDIKVKLGEYTEVEAQRELELNFPQFFGRGRIMPPGMPAPAPKEANPDRQMPRNLGLPKSRTTPLPRDYFWQTRKFIGVTLQELTKELGEYFGLKDGLGLLVAQVEDKSPAQKAGLKVGDVILKADGKQVESSSALSEMIQGRKKGDKIKLEILRDKKPLSLEVEIAEEESSSATFKWTPDEDFGGLRDQLSRLQKDFPSDAFPEIQGNLKKVDEGVLKKIKETDKPSPNIARIMRDGRNFYRI